MIPVEVRKIIVANYEEGISVKEICHIMRVSKSAVYSILKKYRETGSVEAHYPGRQPRITEEQIEAIEKTVLEQPDITLQEIIEKLNLPIAKSQLSNILIKKKFRFKKR